MNKNENNMDSSNTSSRIPKLRFPGFTGEWEEKKLVDVATKINRRNSRLEVTRVLTNSANAGVVDQSEYFDRDIAVKDNTENYHIVDYEDFVYNPRISTAAPVGPISINKVGKGIMSPLYTVFKIHTGCISFFEQYFQTSIWHPYLKSIANFGARFDRMNISTEAFFNMPLLLPTFAEQQKIASCLSELDNLITVQGQKVDALKEKKKGLMQQLFPRQGETVPRLRFPGFTGNWEEKKFGELIDESRESSTIENEDILLTSSIEGMFLNSEVFSHQRGKTTIGYRKIKKGMLVLSAQNLHLGNANVNMRFDSGLVSPAYKVYNIVGCLPQFLAQWVKRDSTKQFFLKATTQGASECRKNVVWDQLYQQTIAIPSIPEQGKIAECLSALDETITAEADKLEALKNHKKGLMQQLFPQLEK